MSDSEREKKSNKSAAAGTKKTVKAGKGNASGKAKADKSPLSSIDKKLEKEAAINKSANARYAADPKYHGHSKLEMRAREIGFALLAVVIGSLGTASIMLPNGLTFGGITGIARIIQQYTNWNYSLTYYGLSLIITAIVWVFLGWKEVRKILLMSMSYPSMSKIVSIG